MQTGNNSEEMEATLWSYIDGQCSDQERSAIERLIEEHAEWRAQYHELLALHQTLAENSLEEPSMRFTQNVMDEIARLQIAPATRNYINRRLIWGIGIFFIVLLLGYVVYGVAQIDWSSAESPKSTLGVDFNKVDYSQIFNNNFVNGFLMLNVVLGLMLLDRYLNAKKKQLSGRQ